MSFKPPLTLPITSPDAPGSPWPNQIQQPIQTRQTIDASKNWFDTTQDAASVANGIVDYHGASISNFVATQRRDYGAGIVRVHSKFLNLPGLTLQYENQFGQERLTMTAYPENVVLGGPSVETNYDGYIAFVSNGNNIGFTSPGYDEGVTYEFSINQKVFHTYFQPKLVTEIIVFRFGKTALRCQSLADKPDGPGNPNAVTLGLVAAIEASRAKTKAFSTTGATGSAQIPAHHDLPIYSIYNWDDPLQNGGHESQLPKPTVTKVFDFIGQDNPIDSKGMNKLRIKMTPNMKFIPGAWVWYFNMIAEFYSRAEFRNVSVSWTKASKDGSANITVNDAPLYWQMISPNQPHLGMDIDLSPTKIDRTRQTDVTGFTGTGDGGGKGYWRIGDNPCQQELAPQFPWGVALLAASLTRSTWNLTFLLWTILNIGGPVTLSVIIAGLNAGEANFNQVLNKAQTIDAFIADQGTTGSIQTSLSLAEQTLPIAQANWNVILQNAIDNNDFGPNSAYALGKPLYDGIQQFITINFPQVLQQETQLLSDMATYKLPA